jgi:RNA polymerase sigma factor (sigma-70 family)
MSKHAGSVVLRAVRATAVHSSTDQELLASFAAGNQDAFAALVARHAAMVLGVCRRTLANAQDAEDACQAVFLVLANRARTGNWQDSVANWLFTTARKVAANARRAGARRLQREAQATPPTSTSLLDQMSGREAFAILDEELDKLPAIYREPLVLCYLEGLTRDEAAARQGVPVATLKSQLERGRKKLGDALTKRGVVLGAGLLAVAVTSPVKACSPHLIESILTAAVGQTPAAVGELARGVAVKGALTRIKLAVVAAIGLAVMGIGLAAVPPRTIEQLPSNTSPTFATNYTSAPPKAADAKSEEQIEVKGVVLGSDDKPVPEAKLFLIRWNKSSPTPKAVAGQDGTFAFSVEDGRNAYIVATAPGYGLGWSRLEAHPPGALSIRLTPEESITGKIINLEGNPVAGVTVSVVAAFQAAAGSTFDEWLRTARDLKNTSQPQLEAIRTWDGFLTGSGLIESAISDHEGKFEIKGLGRDRLVLLRVSGRTTATHWANVITRKHERFRGHGVFLPGEVTYQGSSPLLVAVPVPVTTGRVIDSATGKAVPGTVLWVDHLVQQNTLVTGVKAVADKDGRFTLPGLPPDNFLSVLVIPPEDAPYHRLNVRVPTAATERAAFDVKLTRGILATVKIVDKATGKPAKAYLRYGVFPGENTHVKAVPNVWHNDYWTNAPQVRLSQSEFKVVVFPGKGLLAAEAARSDEYLSGVGVEAFKKYHDKGQLYGLVSAPNIYPDQWHTFSEIDVPEDAKEFHTTLALDRGFTVTGKLVDADGKAVVGAESFGLGNHMSRSGAWSEPATEAKFTALALREGQQRRVMFVHTERKLAGAAVVVGGEKEQVEVRMESWGEVTGRLVGVDGKPVTGRVDSRWDVVSNPDLKLGSSPFCCPGVASVSVVPDGRFRITGLVPGLTYRWIAQHPIDGGTKSEVAIIPDVIPKSGQTTDLGDVTVREQP